MFFTEIFQSQAHKRHSKEAFIISNFNLNHGGNVPVAHFLKVEKDEVGPSTHPNAVVPDQLMINVFQDNNPPPKGK